VTTGETPALAHGVSHRYVGWRTEVPFEVTFGLRHYQGHPAPPLFLKKREIEKVFL
jgi:hypothetical protein